jgi:hypothetical protein
VIRQFCVYADCLSYPNIPSKKHESEVKKSKKLSYYNFLSKKHNRGLIPFQCVFPNSNFFIYLQMKKILLGGFVYENEKQGVVNCWNNRLYRDESQYHKF